MRSIDIIIKKRNKEELSQQEIDYFVKGFTKGDIPDYQVSAWAMAVLLNGMTAQETTDLTMAMVHSGDVLTVSDVVPIAVDKHSTGGVGDKTTLVIEPAVVACGLPIGKMSGRGLGFSGGTLDKMESIPGFRTDLSQKEFLTQLKEIGIVLTGQTGDLAPADGKLYALRDVTGTVPSIPLIASSVMSKKIAAGAHAVLLDVKIGKGAFMKTVEDARSLAELMVNIAELADLKAMALLSDMNQPLGNAVGNALEVKEAIQTLQGGGPADFKEHCLEVAGHMLILGKICDDTTSARELLINAIAEGRAWERFVALVQAQGGDVGYVESPERLPKAKMIESVPSPQSGYIKKIDARVVGETSVLLGGGRTQKSDTIDHAVGVIIQHKIGDQVNRGEPLFDVHANSKDKCDQARQLVLKAYEWTTEPVDPLPLFYGVVQ